MKTIELHGELFFEGAGMPAPQVELNENPQDLKRHLQAWTRECSRVLPILRAWQDALLRRDLPGIERLQETLQNPLETLEKLDMDLSALRLPEHQQAMMEPVLSQARRMAAEVAQIMQNCHSVILSELDYTHGLISMIVRADEGETYAQSQKPNEAPSLLLNAEA
jgi:hypothetical protein